MHTAKKVINQKVKGSKIADKKEGAKAKAKLEQSQVSFGMYFSK
ncbi:hypothetical protein [Chryseobacterium lathyri]|uniref:Uncharacterized protein n=1 Tax=Chryseobacterium lathyri TaxID=395933 RepID=A0ABT9SP18_9FLAO|nr:hypothetical protein [Chryseobacterium lathyri]MDP9960551.1 hypothetical protein [Chryseobacterium lathyri]MDQ0067203.1 hypothetical protein [Chryseobacterium lathyri]